MLQQKKTDTGLGHEVSVCAGAGRETVASIRATVRALMPLTKYGPWRPVQGETALQSLTRQLPRESESGPRPLRWRRGSRGGGPRAGFQQGRWTSQASLPPRPGPRSCSAHTGSSVPLPLAYDPQAGVIDLQASRKGAPWPLSETPVLCRRSDQGALENVSDDLVRWFSLLGSELSFPHWH